MPIGMLYAYEKLKKIYWISDADNIIVDLVFLPQFHIPSTALINGTAKLLFFQ